MPKSEGEMPIQMRAGCANLKASELFEAQYWNPFYMNTKK